MKKVVCILMVLIMLLACCACGSKSEDLLSEIKDRGYIVVATEGNWAPWTYHDENDKLTGFDVELAKMIAAKIGVEARFEETPWESILAGIDAGRFDMACNGVGYTEDRAEKYAFSTPYVYMGTVLVVRKDNTDIKKFEDIKGKMTANTASSTYAMIAEGYGATVTPVDDLAETISLLEDGRIDATLNAAASIADYLSQKPDANIKIVAISTDDAELDCIPVAKTDAAASLHNEIDKILDELRNDGSLAELSVKFFGADYTKKP